MTNNSLREEIIQSIKDNVDNMAWNETTEICADEIISIFEKRIDVRIIQVNDQPLFNIAFRQGYNTALDWVKKEMLK